MTTKLTGVEMTCTRTAEDGTEHKVQVLFTIDGWHQWGAEHSVLCDNTEFLDALKDTIVLRWLEEQSEDEAPDTGFDPTCVLCETGEEPGHEH